MSFDPPPLPPQGYLLAKLGYVEEAVAAIAIDVSPQTMIEYRKKGLGPDYTIVGRTVLYHPAKLEAWLEPRVRDAGIGRAGKTWACALSAFEEDAVV